MTRATLNRRLTTTDAAFLYVERANQPMHIGSCNMYEGHVSREALMQTLLDRLHLLPRYRQRVIFPPFGLAHPTWEDDPEFDVRNHVVEVQLPDGADDRVMAEVGGQVFAQVLDRRRPLWKLVLLQGRADGNTAMLAMIHHAMVDGVSGVELQTVIHDLTASAEPPAAPPAPWQPDPLPDPISLMQEAVRDRLTETARIWTDEVFRPLRPEQTSQRMQQMNNALTSSFPYIARPAPSTPFNGTLSTERGFAWTELQFAEVRGIRAALGGTVNDVVLAILSGALGRYLTARGQRVDRTTELRAMCPVSVRREEQRGALGNQVSMMIAPLFVGIADPIERFQAERAAMERLKGLDQAGGLFALTTLADSIPPAWQAFAGQMEVPPTLLNTVSTNVPGPQIPLFLASHQLMHWYPLGPLASGIGLFVAILSYNKLLTFGFTTDPRLVPDVWEFSEHLRESFEELRDAARAQDTAQAAASVDAITATAATPLASATVAEQTEMVATNGHGRRASGGTARSGQARSGREGARAARGRGRG